MTSAARKLDNDREPIRAQLLTNVQAAAYLGISSGTLNNWRAKGEGPRPTMLGRLVRYSVHELDRYIARNTKDTA